MIAESFLHISFYMMALFMCVTVIIYTFIQGRIDKPQNKVFFALAVILMCNAISGAGAAICEYFIMDQGVLMLGRSLFQFSYFLLHPLLATLFFVYSLHVTGMYQTLPKMRLNILLMPSVLLEILVIITPFTGCVYYYDEAGVFHRNWGEVIMYVVAGLYFLLTMIRLFTAWMILTTKRRFALIYFLILTLAGIFTQILFISIKSEIFAEGLALLGLMLAVEDEDEWIDTDSGFYNRTGLRVDLDSFLAAKQVFSFICVKITNADLVKRITGSEDVTAFINVIGEYLMTIVPRYQIYHPNPDTFLLLIMNDDRDGLRLSAEKIVARFKESWTCYGSDQIFTAVVMYAQAPNEFSSTEDIVYMADHEIPSTNTKELLFGEDMSFLVHRLDVEKAIKRAIDGVELRVYYQPTYTIDGELHGAEALVRLIDEDMGFVPPDEFIPIAEQMGVIEDIDDFVLGEVCDFLYSGIPTEHGMESINVNLSVLQCMRPGFPQHVMEIVDNHQVDTTLINFEITESVAANDYKILSRVVSELKSSGFMFSMDDYGTGYSNMTSMFTLDFDVVKIDKSILWNAFESETGMFILESSIQMIRQMRRKILVEGVETAEQVELLRKLGVDYLQGFYFSKPVPKEELMEKILLVKGAD